MKTFHYDIFLKETKQPPAFWTGRFVEFVKRANQEQTTQQRCWGDAYSALFELPEELDPKEARRRLKIIAAAKSLGPMHLDKSQAVNLWALIEAAATRDDSRHKYLFQFLEQTYCSLLLAAGVAAELCTWRLCRRYDLLRQFCGVLIPKHAGKKPGGRFLKKWNAEKNAECFARIHEKARTKKMSVRRAAVLVAEREMKIESAELLRKKYEKTLAELKDHLSPKQIDRAVTSSFF